MGARDIIGPFNRFVANVKEVMPLKNNPLNTVLFIGTTKTEDLKQHSGAISTAEISKISAVLELNETVKTALTQKDVGGNPILPKTFYTAGINLTEATDIDMEALIKQVCVDYKAQACVVVFDDPQAVFAKTDFLKNLDPILNSWDSWAVLTANTQNEITEQLKTTTRISAIKAHKKGTDSYEKHADSALVGRVVFMGVGKVDGEAKELYGITADKLSIAENDGGDLTASEGASWVDTSNVNVYVQTVDSKLETSGFKLLSGREFVNSWELTKVKLDLRNDLVDLRHNNERMGVSALDEATVRGAIVDRLEKLKVNPKDPALNPNGILVDYMVTTIPLDRTLEDNIFKFAFDIKVSLRGILKFFDLSITGYTDGRVFVEVTE